MKIKHIFTLLTVFAVTTNMAFANQLELPPREYFNPQPADQADETGERSPEIDPRITQGAAEDSWHVPADIWDKDKVKQYFSIKDLQYYSRSLRYAWLQKSRQIDEHIKWIIDTHSEDHTIHLGFSNVDKRVSVNEYLKFEDREKLVDGYSTESINFSIDPKNNMQIKEWPCAFPGPRHYNKYSSCAIIVEANGKSSKLDVFILNEIDTSEIYDGDILLVSGTLRGVIGRDIGNIYLEASEVKVIATEVLSVYEGRNYFTFK